MEERAHVDVAVVAEVDNDDSGLVGAPALVQADPEVYLWVCPNCGRRLQRRQCKARCMRCGFFQDCGDTGV